jgi:8-oxo-dGTP pyrophosphatase MutT (NUDIX family)
LLPGETHRQALLRELSEETGAHLLSIEGEAGRVTEYDCLPDDSPNDLFKMLSVYYWCRIDPHLGSTHLDPYEQALGYTPVWVSVQTALETNRAIRQAGRPPRWAQRETMVLEILASQLRSQGRLP